MDAYTALLAMAGTTAAAAALLLGAFGRRQAQALHHGGLRWWLAVPWAVAAGAALGALWPATEGRLLAALLLLAWPSLTLVGLRRFHARLSLPGHEQLDLLLLGLAWGVVGLTAWQTPHWLAHAAATMALALCLYGAAVVVGALGTVSAAGPSARGAAGHGGQNTKGGHSGQNGPSGPSGHSGHSGPGVTGAPTGHRQHRDGELCAPAPLLVMALVMALAGGLSAWPVLSLLGPGPGLVVPLATAGALWADAAASAMLAHALASSLAAVVTAFTVQWLLAERTERQLRDSRRRLRALANQDALTQVPNRRHFRDLASQALRQDSPGSAVVLIFDIDHFKLINDEGGHAAGDRALCLVASCMVEHLRTADVAGRHGGDEFVLLLRQASTAEAMRVAARIVAAIQQRSPALQLPLLTLSFGMVQVGAAEPLDEALRRADQALYEAKRQGRSRAVAAQGDELEPVFSESRRLGLTAL